MMIVPVIFLIALAGLSSAAKYSQDDMCRNKIRRFSTLSEVSELEITTAAQHAPGHCTEMTYAMQQLQYVINMNKKRQVCWYEVGTAFQILNNKYFNGRSSAPIESFSKALGYEVSAYCKLSLLENAPKMTEALRPEDVAPIVEMETKKAFILDTEFKSHNQADNTRIVAELLKLTKSMHLDKSAVQEKITKTTSDFLFDFACKCESSYRPIYEANIRTIISLADIGLDYNMNARVAYAQRAAFEANTEVQRWLNIMLTCEILRHSVAFNKNNAEKFVNSERVNKDTFESLEMPDDLKVEQDGHLRPLAEEASSEATRIARALSLRMGAETSFLSRFMGNQGTSFALNYINYIDSQMRA